MSSTILDTLLQNTFIKVSVDGEGPYIGQFTMHDDEYIQLLSYIQNSEESDKDTVKAIKERDYEFDENIHIDESIYLPKARIRNIISLRM